VFNEVDEEEIVAGSIRIWFSDHEVEMLLKGADERDRLVIKTMATLGLRIGEIAALRVKDFDTAQRQLTVRSTLSTKAKRFQQGAGVVRKNTKTAAGRRRINLPSHLADEIKAICVGRQDTAPLFASRRGGILRPDNFRSRNWTRALSRSGIEGRITPHDLRHFAASKMLGDGIDIALVSRMLGHANVGITDKLYRHLMPEHSHDAAEYWDRPENQLGTRV
jgi:integrase